jgi:hypothetical protein
MSDPELEAAEVQHEPQVLEGDDDSPRQPAPPLDPYTPEPGPRAGDRRAFRSLRLVFVVLALAILVVLYLALR